MPERIVWCDCLAGKRINALTTDILVIDVACRITRRRASRQRRIHDANIGYTGVESQTSAAACKTKSSRSSSLIYYRNWPACAARNNYRITSRTNKKPISR